MGPKDCSGLELCAILTSMKTAGIRHAQKGRVAALEGEDVEAALLAKDTGFQALIAERRRYRGPLLTHEEVKARLLPRRKPGAKQKRPKGPAQG